MGDLDEIITTFPPSKTRTGKTKCNRTKKEKKATTEKQTNETKPKAQGVVTDVRAFVWFLPTEPSPRSALALGRLGRGAV